jgi:hypothetical protein
MATIKEILAEVNEQITNRFNTLEEEGRLRQFSEWDAQTMFEDAFESRGHKLGYGRKNGSSPEYIYPNFTIKIRKKKAEVIREGLLRSTNTIYVPKSIEIVSMFGGYTEDTTPEQIKKAEEEKHQKAMDSKNKRLWSDAERLAKMVGATGHDSLESFIRSLGTCGVFSSHNEDHQKLAEMVDSILNA